MLSNDNHKQLIKRIVDSPNFPAMQAALQQLDSATPQHRLTPSEKLALVRNLRLVLAKSLPVVKNPNSNPTDRDRAIRALRRQLSLPRFRFLNQIPQARTSLLGQLKGTGVTFEDIQHEWESKRSQQWLFETPVQTEIFHSKSLHFNTEFESQSLFEAPFVMEIGEIFGINTQYVDSREIDKNEEDPKSKRRKTAPQGTGRKRRKTAPPGTGSQGTTSPNPPQGQPRQPAPQGTGSQGTTSAALSGKPANDNRHMTSLELRAEMIRTPLIELYNRLNKPASCLEVYNAFEDAYRNIGNAVINYGTAMNSVKAKARQPGAEVTDITLTRARNRVVEAQNNFERKAQAFNDCLYRIPPSAAEFEQMTQRSFGLPFKSKSINYCRSSSNLEGRQQWMFELPFTDQEYYSSSSEADAMFNWGKGKAKSSAKPPSPPSSSAASNVSTLVRQLDNDPNPNRSLAKEEQNALTSVIEALISKSILQKKEEITDPNSSPKRKQELRKNLERLVNLGRFRFLRQLPELRRSLITALDGTGVKFPH